MKQRTKILSIIGLLCLFSLTKTAYASSSSYNFNTGILHLPVVIVPDSGVFNAAFINTGSRFELQAASFANNTDIANTVNPATYVFANKVLTIPVVDLLIPDGSVVAYFVELQLVEDSDPLAFTLLSASPVGNGTPSIPSNDPVTAQLQQFNIDTSATPRADKDGNSLPGDFSPLGASFDMNRTDELFLLGIELETATTSAAFIELRATSTSPSTRFATDELNIPNFVDTPWSGNSVNNFAIAQTVRASTNADLDNDGLEETIVVYRIEEEGAARLKITRFADAEANFAAMDGGTLAFIDDVADISVTAGDYDGDGDDEIVIALSKPSSIEIMFVSFANGMFSIDAGAGKTILSGLENATLNSILTTGNIDYDNSEEFALVVSEFVNSDVGISRYYLFDDKHTSYAQIASSAVQAPNEIGVMQTAVVADVSLGDIDGDGLDEIVFAGLTNISSGGGCKAYGHLLFALDDKTHQLANLGSKYFEYSFKNCPSYAAWKLRYLHVNTVDLDGDNVAEIQANQFVFNNFKDSAPWTDLYTMPQEVMFDNNGFGFFDKSTSAIEAGDVTGDGRKDIIIYNQSLSGDNKLIVWGDHQVNGFSMLASIPVKFKNSQTKIHPIIVAVNADKDGPVLKYTDAEYRFVFTEPVLIAALAAAPCAENIGQVIDDCRTRYGTASTVSVDAEAALTLSAGVHVGAKGEVKVFGIGAELEAIKETTVSVTGSILAAYSLEQSVIFTSGPLQDSVIFTTIPLDQYTYTIVSHPIPEMVGQQVVISLPRKPITIMANRDFYNQTVDSDGLSIGSNVFQHTPGDLDSYPTATDKDRITAQYFDTLFDVVQNPPAALLDALSVLELKSDLQTVDQGSGSREVTLQVNQAFGVGVGSEVSRELRVSGTALGRVTGFTVGASASASLSISRGTSTIYAGSVGAIDAGNFANNVYSYGLFAYTFKDQASAQEFEVINYWVEK